MHDYENLDKPFFISELIVKYIKKELSIEEEEILNKWLGESEANQILFRKLLNTKIDGSNNEFLPVLDKKQAWENVLRHTSKSYRKYNYIKYAAAVLLPILFIGTIYFVSNEDEKSISAYFSKLSDSIANEDILAPNMEALLTLADGSIVSLDESNPNFSIQQSGITLNKSEDGALSYTVDEIVSDQVGYNSVSIPSGGMYKLVLPDGTRVWLSSTSSLRFPVAFLGKERRVELIGEAYFEVAKNLDKPFFVKVKNTEVRVLGTHFNIKAYEEEKVVKTTLVEGLVEVKHQKSKVVLKPGQEVSAFTDSEDLRIRKADLEEVLAWKNGVFIFRDEPLESIMQRISRWYDITVSYESNALKQKTFGGKFSKNSTLSELLKSLELTGTVKFKQEERRVTVMN